MTDIPISADVLRSALPMMVIIESGGHVIDAGRTLAKLAPGIVGQPIARVIRIVQPEMPAQFGRIARLIGRRLLVQLPGEAGGGQGIEPTVLRCAAMPLADGRQLLNLTFGADPTQALRRHKLTAQDFLATDPMVDFLFLQEAHAVVLAEFQRLSDRLEAARLSAEEEAVTDKLTGLRNRRAMDMLLQRLTRQDGVEFALMNLDLDYFKRVNDTLGHAAGDRVLEEVAAILRDVVRQGDMVARVGGDEFMIVFDDCSDATLLETIAARIIEQLERPIEWQGELCRISGSIGITMSKFYDPIDPARMITDADAALYASKRRGRARFSLATPPPNERAIG